MKRVNFNFYIRDKKTIVFVSTFSFLDKNTAGYNRIINYAKALACSSINVIIFSFYDKYESINDLEPIHENIYIIKKKNKSFSTWSSFLSLNRLRRSVNDRASYVYYPSSRFLADLIFISVLKIFSSNKIYCEINELRHAYVKNRSLTKNLFFRIFATSKNAIDVIFYKTLEFSYSKYNGVITISNNLYNYIKKYNSNVILVPILVDVPQIKEYSSLSITEYFRIGFFGTISFKKEGLINIFEAIKNLGKNNYKVKLFLYGSISEVERMSLQNYMEQGEISGSIVYLGIIPHEKILAEMRKMNLLILPRPLNIQTNFGFSTKLAEYLISGVPVLVTNVSDNKLYIKDGFNGYIVDEVSPNGFVRKIVQIINNYEQNKYRISAEGYETALNYFDYKLYKDKLTEFLINNDK